MTVGQSWILVGAWLVLSAIVGIVVGQVIRMGR